MKISLVKCVVNWSLGQFETFVVQNMYFWPALVSWVLYSSLRSRRYSRAQGEKLEIPPAQKLSILSSAHRAHGSAHINVFALENQSERELLIMLLAGLQCSKRCQFNNCFVFFYHGEQNNSHETFVKAYTVNIVLLPTPVGKIAITSVYQATNVGLICFAHTSSRWVDRWQINSSMISQYIR